MAGNRDVFAVYHSSCSEPQMVWGSSEREIYAFPDMADGAGGVSSLFHDRIHGQWCHSFPQRSILFTNPWRKRFREKTSYAVSLLGICVDVTSSWAALEYDAGSGSVEAVKGTKRDIGNYTLLKIHFVFFDYDEPLFFFLLDYIAVMGLFVFIGHYLAVFLRQHGRKKKV